jgi:hypothetical protein
MNMRALATTGFFTLATMTIASPAFAQQGPAPAAAPDPNAPMPVQPVPPAPGQVGPTIDANGTPLYTSWQTGWDTDTFDHHHVILGVVADFKPFRLQVSRPDGPTQTIDLKQGTTILPGGMTPMPNQKVAVIGYYSNGTFIANRVILHI